VSIIFLVFAHHTSVASGTTGPKAHTTFDLKWATEDLPERRLARMKRALCAAKSRLIYKKNPVTYVRLNEYKNNGKDRIHLSILDANGANGKEFILPSPIGVSKQAIRATSTTLQKHVKNEPDPRVVYIERIGSSGLNFDREYMRSVQAAVAFLASKGLISCESLVAIFDDHMPKDSSFRNSFRPLGQKILVLSARELSQFSSDLHKKRRRLSSSTAEP
jgi:hypothetical protein